MGAPATLATTRSRRPNAGRKLAALISSQDTLVDDQDELFQEFDDDEEFDVDNQPVFVADGDDVANEVGGGEDEEEGEEESEDSDSSIGSSNFSDSDESGVEDDNEPEDAGERELQRKQREETRVRKKAERKKMFTIKRRASEPENDTSEPKRKKRRELPSAESMLLDTGRRESKRRSARLTKEHLIEQIREHEARRAQYVPPKVTNRPKLTQEQRLAEAKITEEKNLASLNRFVELEEERKYQQRLAMLGRRTHLSEFVRYHSATVLVYPLPEPTRPPPATSVAEAPMIGSEGQKSDVLSTAANDASSSQTATPTQSSPAPQQSSGGTANSQETDLKPEKPEGHAEIGEVGDASSTPRSAESTREQSTLIPGDEKKSATPELLQGAVKSEHTDSTSEPNVGTLAAGSAVADANSANKSPASEVAEVEMRSAANVKGGKEVEENSDTTEQELYGPPAIKNIDILTLHDLPPGTELKNKNVVRGLVFGQTASRATGPPPKRLCPFTGKLARYLDPTSGVAYFGLDANRMIAAARSNEFAWSNELGGVFTGWRDPEKQQHAKGVPPGFY